jgi:ubiquinone/menaquinone biosynthesis C-methylase UbiE
MIRRTFIGLLIAVAAGAQTPKGAPVEREELVVDDFPASGYILDLGGGCRGTIGRLKGQQVVAIDISLKELQEVPSGFLKIVMDATDLKFLPNSFQTVTAFFSLMFMKQDIHPKVFSEAFRVLQPGGKWLIWDAAIPARSGSIDPQFLINLHTKLPKETIDFGYSAHFPERSQDPAYYRGLAEQAGFRVTRVEELGRGKIVFLELRKP